MGYHELISDALQNRFVKIDQGKCAALARSAVEGCSASRTFIEDTAVAEIALDALANILSNPGEDFHIDLVARQALSERVSGLRGQLDAFGKPAADLLGANSAHHQKHDGAKRHADRVAYAHKGSKLSKNYQKEARRLTADIMKLTESFKEQLGGSKRDVPWGQFLFDAIVNNVTLPKISLRENCSPNEAWKHVDKNAHDGYRESCQAFNPRSENDPFGFMCMHLGQALTIHKSADPGSERDPKRGVSPDTPLHRRDVAPSASESSDDESLASSDRTPRVGLGGQGEDVTDGFSKRTQSPLEETVNIEQYDAPLYVRGGHPRSVVDGEIRRDHQPIHTEDDQTADTSSFGPAIDAKHGGIVNSTIVGGDLVVSGDTNITINLCPDLFHIDHAAAVTRAGASSDEQGVLSAQMAYLRAAVQTTLEAITAVRSHRSGHSEAKDLPQGHTHHAYDSVERTTWTKGPARLFRAGEPIADRLLNPPGRSRPVDRGVLAMRTDSTTATLASHVHGDAIPEESAIMSPDTPTSRNGVGLSTSGDLQQPNDAIESQANAGAEPNVKVSTYAENQTPARLQQRDNAMLDAMADTYSASAIAVESDATAAPRTELLNLLTPSTNDQKGSDESSHSAIEPKGLATSGATQRRQSLERVPAAVNAAVSSVEHQGGGIIRARPVVDGKVTASGVSKAEDAFGSSILPDEPALHARHSNLERILAGSTSGSDRRIDVHEGGAVKQAVEPSDSKVGIESPATSDAVRTPTPAKRVSTAIRAAAQAVEAQHARLNAAKFNPERGGAVSSNSSRSTNAPGKPWASSAITGTSAPLARRDGSKEAKVARSEYTGRKWDVVLPTVGEMYAPLGLTALMQPSNKVDPGRPFAPTPVKGIDERASGVKSPPEGKVAKSSGGTAGKRSDRLPSAQPTSAVKRAAPTNEMLLTTNGGRRFDMRSSHVRAANPTSEMQASWRNGGPRPARETKPAWR